MASSSNDLNKKSDKRRTEEEEGLNSRNGGQGTSSKRLRTGFDFWKKNESTELIYKDDVQYLEIEDLKIGRVIQKPIRIRVSYKNSPRDTKVGLVFYFYGITNSGEISFINYGKESIRINEDIKVNSIYSIQNFIVEKENPAYPNNLTTQFQIKLNLNSEINIIEDDTIMREIPFHFVQLDSIPSLIYIHKIDVIGILINDDGVKSTDRGSFKRELTLTDDSKQFVIATLWSKEAHNFHAENFSVVVIRNANLVEYDGNKKLNCLSGCLVWCDPEITKASELSAWFQKALKKDEEEESHES